MAFAIYPSRPLRRCRRQSLSKLGKDAKHLAYLIPLTVLIAGLRLAIGSYGGIADKAGVNRHSCIVRLPIIAR